MSAKIYDLLYQLGVTANYTGFFHTAYAVSLCAQQPDRLLLVTKRLYPEVARQYQTNWKAVERNIRTVGSIIWRENRPLLERLAHRNLSKKPPATQLLAILASALNDLEEDGRLALASGQPPGRAVGQAGRADGADLLVKAHFGVVGREVSPLVGKAGGEVDKHTGHPLGDQGEIL